MKSYLTMLKSLNFFKNYFNKIVGKLDINLNLESVRESFNEDPVLTSFEKYATHPCIKKIKSRMFKSLF